MFAAVAAGRVVIEGPKGAAIEMERRWYVVEVKQHQEGLVQATLAERGYATYVPRIRQWPRPPVGSPIVPLFPGYVFARLRMPEDYYPVSWSIGVKRLLAFGDELAVLPDEAVEFLRSREDEHGLIQIQQPSACGKATVRIVRGTFKGFEAVVERRLSARDRVVVLIDFLQRQTRVELPETWLRQA